MKFYVIYSFDCTKNDNPKYYDPPYKDDWTQTEGDDEWDYNYLADENPHNADMWRDGHHRKYVYPDMDKAQFLHFLKETSLCFEDVETMGSLTDIGWMPAFAFRASDSAMSIYDNKGLVDAGAYVTPIPEPVRPMFSVRHREDQECFWPLTDEEMEAYVYNRQRRYWDIMRKAFGKDY
jgi:hypothetical protein